VHCAESKLSIYNALTKYSDS